MLVKLEAAKTEEEAKRSVLRVHSWSCNISIFANLPRDAKLIPTVQVLYLAGQGTSLLW